MKIIHIESRFHPSYGYQVQQLVNKHTKTHEVVVITSDSFGSLSVKDPQHVFDVLDKEYEAKTGARIVRLKTTLECRDKLYMKDLSRQVELEKPDVIFSHAVEYIPFMQLVISGVARRYPLLTDCHDLPTADKNYFLRLIFRLPLRLITIRHINKFKRKCYYVQPQSIEILKSYGVNDSLLDYLPLGVDTDIFKPSKSLGLEYRQKYQITEEDFVILYTGKMDEDKDPALILDAFKTLPEEIRSTVKVFLVGACDENYHDSRLREYDALLNEQTLFRIAPVPFTELVGFYAMADISVFPLKNTMSALDAMACSLPVVMQSDKTNDQRLEGAGMTYEARNIQNLAKCIEALAVNRETREAMGRCGVEYVKAYHSYDGIVKKLESDMQASIDQHKVESGDCKARV